MSIIETIAGNGNQGYSGEGGKAVNAEMDNPFHVDIDTTRRYLYFADCFNYRVRRVDLSQGTIENFAGTGMKGHSGDGGAALEADIEEIYAIQVDKNGDVYICQRFNPAIRKIDGKTGIITTVAGTGHTGSGKDDIPATESAMIEPNDCVLDGKGGLLIADVQDQKIRRLDLETGLIHAFAGTGAMEHSGDGEKATTAGIFGARAVCVDKIGNTYLCERGGNTIRQIDASGIITTIAGTGDKGYTGDGNPSITATLNGPKAIRCDNDGNIIVVDTENHSLRLISITDGLIKTICGGVEGPHGDGSDPLKAGMARPHGVVVGPDNEIYIADSENHRVRMIRQN